MAFELKNERKNSEVRVSFIFRNTKEILGFDDRWFAIHGIVIVSLGMNLILFGSLLQNDMTNLFTGCYITSFIYTTLFWMFFRTLYLMVTTKYPGYENMRKRYIVLIPTVIILFIIIKLLLDLILDPILITFLPSGTEPHALLEFLGSFIFLILVLSIYEGTYLFAELKKSKLQQEVLMKDNISSQLEGLKNQVNPHFLFNSLNTLASIIPEDQERGVRFVTKLSKVYRYILDIKDQKLISVKEELDYLSSYTFLVKERFGENILIDVDVDTNDLEKLIVPLSLQITFENAIKHNVITSSRPLYIHVYVENGNLVVKNNLQKKSTVGNSTKTGLQNIKNRYSFFTEKEVGVISTVHHFIVTLPLLTTSMNPT
ncbi:MAG: histidine kinase [Saprospiraceae bacterium]|nr:histidine kinase [Saprospiraceae bacterium]